MACPFVHLCDRSLCQKEMICMDAGYWAEYWRAKARKEEDELGITKQERRKLRKAAKKEVGRKKFTKMQKESAHRDIFSSTPLCVKDGSWCDKMEACSVLNSCVVSLSRIQAIPELLESMRGPRTLKEIIILLAKHDPKPMKSYYRGKK